MILDELARVFMHPRRFHKAHPRFSLFTHLFKRAHHTFPFLFLLRGACVSVSVRRSPSSSSSSSTS